MNAGIDTDIQQRLIKSWWQQQNVRSDDCKLTTSLSNLLFMRKFPLSRKSW
jgi:hypothetical protein